MKLYIWKYVWIIGLLALIGLMIAAVLPVPEAGLEQGPGVKSVVAGYKCSFAVMDDGTLWAWGDGNSGQLGDGGNTNRLVPAKVPIDDVKAVASGGTSTVVLKNDGTVWAWGDNDWGQLGDGTNISRSTPVQVKGIDDVKAVAAGWGHMLALKNDGTVWAWGRGIEGELGTGLMSPVDANGSSLDNNISVPEPVRVPISDVKTIACGAFHSIALKNDGTVWAWGEGEEIGDGNTSNRATPVNVPISDIVSISSGDSTTLAVKADGTVWGWGHNMYYPLGNVTDYSVQLTPVKADRLKNVVQVAAGDGFSVALTRDGRVYTWGEHQRGMLGNGQLFGYPVAVPEPVLNLTGVKEISAGGSHSLVLRTDGTVFAWGDNYAGQIGIGKFSNDGIASPVQVFVGQHSEATPVPTASPLPVRPTIPFSQTTKPANSNVTVVENWSAEPGGNIDYMADAGNGNIYTFKGNVIRCISPNGSEKWNLTVPDRWRICCPRDRPVMMGISGGGAMMGMSWPVYGLSNGTLYVYVDPNVPGPGFWDWGNYYDNTTAKGYTWAVIAISPEGTILWEVPLDTWATPFDDTLITAVGDRVYVFHGYNETVLDKNGTVVCRIQNVSAPAGIDEEGNIYVVDAVRRYWYEYKIDGNSTYADYRTPSSLVKAYGKNGMLLWQKDIGDRASPQYVVEGLRAAYGTTPLYQHGTLYVPVQSGVVALDKNGNLKWSKHMESGVYQLFPLMPVDSSDNVYMAYLDTSTFEYMVYVISHNGRDISAPRKYKMNYNPVMQTGGSDGVIYDVIYDDRYEPKNLTDLTPFALRAYDLIHDEVLWTYVIPSDHKYTMETDLYGRGALPIRNQILTDNKIAIYQGKDTVFVIASIVNYDRSIARGTPNCVYTSGVYALSDAGEIAFEKPLDTFTTVAMVNNSTIFFGAGNGGISTVSVTAITGLAILAIAFLAIKFLLFGTVARAKNKLNKNQNRNKVSAYITDNPGVTMYEISRGSGMNMGTVRYHMLILELNHKVVQFNDGKFVRYFRNSNFYSKGDQLAISLMRRDTTGRILQALIESPGMTNADLCKKLDQHDSAVSMYMKELYEKGVADRQKTTEGRYAYSVKSEFAEKIIALSGLPCI